MSSEPISITSTDIHTRWTEAPADDQNVISVAVLGGSTTFGTRVTDADSWPALLQDMLGDGYAVTNYGVSGYSTAEAIIQMALIVPETEPNVDDGHFTRAGGLKFSRIVAEQIQQ